MRLTDTVLNSRSQAREYILYGPIYVKFKNRQNYSMVRLVVILEEHPKCMAQSV